MVKRLTILTALLIERTETIVGAASHEELDSDLIHDLPELDLLTGSATEKHGA